MIAAVRLSLLLTCLLICCASAIADRPQALAAINQGRIDDAIRMLASQIARDPHDSSSHQLLCRAFYAIEVEDNAISECEVAAADALSGSETYLWLGRAYGLKASRANPVAAFRLARKVNVAFEQAVKLEPINVSALSDLGEFYVAAPSLVGGGIEKAQQLVTRLMPISPSKAHRLLALIAEKDGQDDTAEAEFRKAVETQSSPAAFVDLAAFYQRRKKNDKCVTAIQAALRLDHARDAALVDAASILTDAERSPQLAQQMLIAYLGSPVKSEDAPAPKVHVQLGTLLLKAGDEAGARREFQAALALAASYAPAQKALKSLPSFQAP